MLCFHLQHLPIPWTIFIKIVILNFDLACSRKYDCNVDNTFSSQPDYFPFFYLTGGGKLLCYLSIYMST